MQSFPVTASSLRTSNIAIISERDRMELYKGDLTLLLDRLSKGDRTAEELLMPSVYAELHRLAMARLRSERENHTLQATALVHEAYMRMCRGDDIRFQDRAHFFRIAARLMRRILVDYARERGAEKRNHGARLLPLENAADISNRPTVDPWRLMSYSIDWRS